MRIDKDDPRSWVKFKKGMCSGCNAGCCTMPVEVKAEDLLRLDLVSQDEIDGPRRKMVNRLKKQGIIKSYRESSQLFMLSDRPNGDCLFLDEKSRQCTVYEKRPNVCRLFPSIGNRPGFCPSTRK